MTDAVANGETNPEASPASSTTSTADSAPLARDEVDHGPEKRRRIFLIIAAVFLVLQLVVVILFFFIARDALMRSGQEAEATGVVTSENWQNEVA